MLHTTPRPAAPAAPAQRDAPVALEPAQFRSLGHELIDRIADFLASVPTRPVTPGETPAEVRERLGATPGRTGEHQFLVTDVPEKFLAVAGRFLGREVSSAEHVDV